MKATWLGYAAALWSLLYGVFGVYWALGGDAVAYPFAPIDEDHRSASLLEGAPAEAVGAAAGVLGLTGVLAGVALARGFGSGRLRTTLLWYGWGLGAVLALVIPDYTLIALAALWPVLIVFAFTGVPGPQDGVADILYWHRVHLIVVFAGGLLWVLAALAYRRRTAGACVRCGRDGRPGTDPAKLRRWGRRAVWVAVLSQIPYEVTRLAWYFGWPLGITDEFLKEIQETPGMLTMGLAAGLLSLGGAALTHGLTARWGEVFPRWTLFLAGRRVPPLLAVIPATVVAVALIPAGLMSLRLVGDEAGWGVTGPSVFWTAWGAALGVAALAYHLRRRGVCKRCGQDDRSPGTAQPRTAEPAPGDIRPPRTQPAPSARRPLRTGPGTDVHRYGPAEYTP
ncbi:NYN domain-containing protein [Streptomyces sp. TRM66268-LWL]|uniref:NYN domain-containing protein n=1 Tax=Streptomyces polyasparticus TaxID=2767826 RepID=A0ABR7SF81_9ACTN|nr:NYN domain-containing protein [Streptomyces polyasparticus]MBC9713126.1 NYN domain-containing protein [Streptomyces polyasparticus]